MYYVKLDNKRSLEAYPYTLTDLRRSSPHVSFPENITDEMASQFNVVPVLPTDPPPEDHTKNVSRTASKIDGNWTEVWVETAASEEEIAQRTSNKAEAVREERDLKLRESDWTQVEDSVCDKAVWAAYRTGLRDLPMQAGFPWEVTWPSEPVA